MSRAGILVAEKHQEASEAGKVETLVRALQRAAPTRAQRESCSACMLIRDVKRVAFVRHVSLCVCNVCVVCKSAGRRHRQATRPRRPGVVMRTGMLRSTGLNVTVSICFCGFFEWSFQRALSLHMIMKSYCKVTQSTLVARNTHVASKLVHACAHISKTHDIKALKIKFQ